MVDYFTANADNYKTFPSGINGWNKITDTKGDIFEGIFVNGVPMGGSLTLKNGTQYEG